MKFNNKLLWLASYVNQIQKTIDISRINEIKVLRTPTASRQTVAGYFKRNEEGILHIELATMYQIWDIKKVRIKGLFPYSKIDMLSHLAHEIAHYYMVIHKDMWDHTPEHKVMEAYITGLFMELLEKEGYISEEAELKEQKRDIGNEYIEIKKRPKK